MKPSSVSGEGPGHVDDGRQNARCLVPETKRPGLYCAGYAPVVTQPWPPLRFPDRRLGSWRSSVGRICGLKRRRAADQGKRESRQLGLGLSARGKVGAFSGRLSEARVAAGDWSTDGDGNIIINPLVEYEMATPTGLGICVRLSVEVQTLERGTRVGNVQLAISPVQARELAYSLLDAADNIERPPSRAGPQA
jgi:hypothetical protein